MADSTTHPRRPSVTFTSGLTPVAPPAPILKNSINNNLVGVGVGVGGVGDGSSSNGNNPRKRRPVEFSSEVSVIHGASNSMRMEEEQVVEEELDESDTDVGSHDFDAEESFDFSCGVGDDDNDNENLTSAVAEMKTAAAAAAVTACGVGGGGGGGKKNVQVGGSNNGTSLASSIAASSTSSSPFIARVGAKIRRLNLNDGYEVDGDGGGSSNVYSRGNGNITMGGTSSAENKMAASGSVFGANSSSGSAGTSLFESPTKKASTSHNIGIINTSNIHCKTAPSPGRNYRNRTMNTMLVRTSYPPSSVKRRGRQRSLFANDKNGSFCATGSVDCDVNNHGNKDGVRGNDNIMSKNAGDDDDISPRDVTNFPSFATWDSPTSKKGTSGGEGCGKENSIIEDAPSSPPPSTSMRRHPPRKLSPPAPPPPTPSMKQKSKPHHRRILDSITPETIQDSLMQRVASGDEDDDDDDDDANETTHSSPPPPRARLGLRSFGRANSFLQMFSQESLIVEENDSVTSERMEDDFIHKPNDNEDDDDGKFTISSPNGNRPNRRRYTPASPESNSTAPSSSCSSSFSRFLCDFEIVGTLGVGSFGSVYSVRNRTDRRLYAIKAAKREARGSSDRDRMLQEVYALSALSDQACMNAMHIVRYHQAWMEGNRLYIQTELCDSTLLQVMRGTGGHDNNDGSPRVYLDEKQRYKLLREMLLALDLVHKSGMIHLDIKPENIFIKNGQYKLGDFGLVSKIENHDDVEEGDSRYMSMELLSGELDDLTKVSEFAWT